MRKVPRNGPHRYEFFDLPLFSWANRESCSPLSYEVRWVKRRAGVPHHLANTIAELAGIGARRKP